MKKSKIALEVSVTFWDEPGTHNFHLLDAEGDVVDYFRQLEEVGMEIHKDLGAPMSIIVRGKEAFSCDAFDFVDGKSRFWTLGNNLNLLERL